MAFDTESLQIELQVFEQTQIEDDAGNFYEFELVGCKCVGTYVRNKRNQNQVSLPFTLRIKMIHCNYLPWRS